MWRGQSKNPEKQEKLDSLRKQFQNGKKKWVRYDEGAILYSVGIHTFMDLAKEAIGRVQRRLNRKLVIEGIILTMVDNRTNYDSPQRSYDIR